MSQTAKILKIKSLGFTLDQIAIQLGLEKAQLMEIIRKDTVLLQQQPRPGKSRSLPKRNDRPPFRREHRSALRWGQ